MNDEKLELVEIFFKKIKGKTPEESSKNHDGSKGHWLEKQFGILPNANDVADIMGYELKSDTNSVTSFGDWSANEYIFDSGNYQKYFKGENKNQRKDSFCRIFGHPNPNKDNRFSWSGKVIPKIDIYNDYGQILQITSQKDIVIIYSFSKDKREEKVDILPKQLQIENLVLAKWYGIYPLENKNTLQKRINRKFNQNGWFTCKQNQTGYYKICFGRKISFNDWLQGVKSGDIYFDSGMYEGNTRKYSQWRASNKYWNSLIIEEYE
ncbi:LlaMI family restriction endonuclease [Mycoplasma sp. 4013]